jgi:hypothetical protein
MWDGCRYAAPPHDEQVARSTCPQSHKNGPRSVGVEVGGRHHGT